MYLVQGNYCKVKEYCSKMFDGRFFEFDLVYVDEQERFREIDRFLYESRHTLRFQNEYVGNVIVNLTEWNTNPCNAYLEAFLYFIKDNAEKYNCVFIMDEKCDEELLELLSEKFEIECIEIDAENKLSMPRIGFAV